MGYGVWGIRTCTIIALENYHSPVRECGARALGVWSSYIHTSRNDCLSSKKVFQSLHTLHPTPYSRFPIPNSRFPIPDSRLPTPYTPHPTPHTLLPER
ncbi:hypothetical protein [Moorena bouillonii]|uniref:hypothetical protein n=1 Tax=Moorena bouillonii TaxID=207920 RepID=UPI0013014B0E|nr:hypothetical protein [Moorena bouillonii]